MNVESFDRLLWVVSEFMTQIHVLNVVMQVFILAAIISVEWVEIGYSNAFGPNDIDSLKPIIGGFHWAFLNNVNVNDLSPNFISYSQLAAD